MSSAKRGYTNSDTGDQTQRRQPGTRDRKQLSLKVAADGHGEIEQKATDRARAVEETAGALRGVYEGGELERLREEWPE